MKAETDEKRVYTKGPIAVMVRTLPRGQFLWCEINNSIAIGSLSDIMKNIKTRAAYQGAETMPAELQLSLCCKHHQFAIYLGHLL